jgi:hypothetical protein
MPTLADTITEQATAYSMLFGPVLHAPSVQAARHRVMAMGFVSYQAVMVILDRIVENLPTVWRNNLDEPFDDYADILAGLDAAA